jgi:hypothetical protein
VVAGRLRVMAPALPLDHIAARDPDLESDGIADPKPFPKPSVGTPLHHEARVHVLSFTVHARKDVAQSVTTKPPTPHE